MTKRSERKSEEKYQGPLTQECAPATRLEDSGEILWTSEDHERHAAANADSDQLSIEEGLSDE